MIVPLVIAAVGAAVKLIGGLFGAAKAAKAAKYRRKAASKGREIVEKEQAVQRRDIVRNLRVARAQALAQGATESGGTRSSGTQGVSGSFASQSLFNLDFFEGQAEKSRRKFEFELKADKYQANAEQTIAVSGLIGDAMQTAGKMMGGMGKGK